MGFSDLGPYEARQNHVNSSFGAAMSVEAHDLPTEFADSTGVLVVINRVEIKYEGRVQGVGFRMQVLDISRGFHVTGHVRNASDGSVRLLAEGTTEELQAFLTAIRKALGRNIVNEQANWSETAAAECEEFKIAGDLLVRGSHDA